MSRTLPLSEAKAKFSEVVDEVDRTHERVTVTRNGRPIAVVVSMDDLEAIEETIAILSDASMLRSIADGRDAVARGDVSTAADLDALRRRLLERDE